MNPRTIASPGLARDCYIPRKVRQSDVCATCCMVLTVIRVHVPLSSTGGDN